MPLVVGLAFTAVKATRLRRVDHIELGRDGVRENRRFYLIDGHDRMINSKLVGELQQVVADYRDAERTLRLELPDGRVIGGEIRLGDQVTTKFFSQTADGHIVEGPWSDALSDCFGQTLRLVEVGDRATAVETIKSVGRSVPVALVMLKARVDKPEAVRRLAKSDGNVRLAIEDNVVEV